MKGIWALVIGLFVVNSGIAGTITGTVRAKGPAAAEQDRGKYQSRKFKFAERINYDQLRNFVVYIDEPPKEEVAPPEKPVKVVTQKDATFRPHVLPIFVGTTVEWPNQDAIYHNVFSISEPKKFDLGLYKKAQRPKQVRFEKPGRVDVFCSIHKDMHCIVLVLESPYFSTTNRKNRYSITDVPAGTYRLKAWHERVPSQTKQVTVPAEGEVEVDFVLGFAESE